MVSLRDPREFSGFFIPSDGTDPEFELSNDRIVFAPAALPKVTVSKERNVSRHDNICDGESVSDTGSKNREAQIVGILTRTELAAFNRVLDENDPLDLVADEWSGEVQVLDGEYTGWGLSPQNQGGTRETVYRYTLNVLSTGKDEASTAVPDGIVSTGLTGLSERNERLVRGIEYLEESRSSGRSS